MTKVLALLLSAGVLLAGCASPSPRIVPPVAPEDVPDDNDVGLIEKTGPDLRAAYGAPAFTRKEGASEIWRYDVGSCRVFFFLSPDGGMLRLRRTDTISSETGVANPGEPVDEACINALVRTAKR